MVARPGPGLGVGARWIFGGSNSGMGAPLLFAYFLQPSATTLTRYLNTWLSLQATNGFRAAQLAYWIDGKPRPDDTPRWNLLDNVLRPAWRGL